MLRNGWRAQINACSWRQAAIATVGLLVWRLVPSGNAGRSMMPMPVMNQLPRSSLVSVRGDLSRRKVLRSFFHQCRTGGRDGATKVEPMPELRVRGALRTKSLGAIRRSW